MSMPDVSMFLSLKPKAIKPLSNGIKFKVVLAVFAKK